MAPHTACKEKGYQYPNRTYKHRSPNTKLEVPIFDMLLFCITKGKPKR